MILRLKSRIWNNIKIISAILAISSLVLSGCGEMDMQTDDAIHAESVNSNEQTGNANNQTADAQSAANSHIDFAALQAQNSEIFAWLYVPGTNIDTPVLQSEISDDYYRTHDADKNEDALGTAYIEQPVMKDMCDFNTVIHGSGDGVFEELVNFENPDFFASNEEFYIYLPDNQLTYEIFAVYERNNTSLIRDYSFAEAKGDREFLYEVYGEKMVGKQIRDGWTDLNEYNFLTTLTIDEPESDKQLVVIGVLTSDAAGTINRNVVEEIDIGPNLFEQ